MQPLGSFCYYDTTARLRGAQSTVGGNTITDSIRYDAYSRRTLHLHTETSPTVSTTEFDLLEGPNFEATLDGAGEVQSAYVFDGIDHPLRMAQVSYACSKDAATACVLSNGSYTCPEANPPSQTCVPSATHAYFYEVDLAGNVRRLRDSSGGMDLGGYRYTAFGNAFPADVTTPAPSIDQPLRWKGRWFEEKIAGGLYDVRARWWSPQLGAFLSVDELAYHDRNSTLWGWPGQNPMVYADPTGHFWWILAGAAAGGALDLGAQLYGNGGNFSQVDWGEVAGWTAAGAGVGLLPEFALGSAFSGLSTSGGLTAVTSWAPQGVDATIAAGRWVMLGGATVRNWLLSGTGYPLTNGQTEYVLSSELQNVPNEIGGTGGACVTATKQAIGQRIVGGP